MTTHSVEHPVQLVAAYDVNAACDALFIENEAESGPGRLLRILFPSIPLASELLEAMLLSLAEAAFCLWPNWYRGEFDLTRLPHRATLQQHDLLTHSAVARGTSLKWLLSAIDCCGNGRIPVVPPFQPIEQIRHLVRALDPDLTLVLCCTVADPPGERLLGLARMVEHLAHQAEVRIVVIVPHPLATAKELDSINYACRVLQDQAPQLGSESETCRGSNVPIQDEPTRAISALRGQPHPESPGEQKLAHWLAGDAQLADLFVFNQPVKTTRGSRYLVDLLWSAGSLVVEVDGYRTHTTPHQFRLDRQRDYELALSGYVVLRLTHEEVMQDVVLAGEKIRDLVNMRSKSIVQTI